MSDEALRPVVVAKKTIEAHNMASFELVPTDGGELAPFSAGSHIDVTIPGGLVRQYSLVNPSTERHRYLIGIWRDANSRGGSRTMFDKVQEGDTLEVSLPRNRFRVPKSTKRAILMARGIGATPVLSIADYLKSQDIPFELHYVYALMSPGSFKTTIENSKFAEHVKFYKEAEADKQLINPGEILSDQPDDMHLFICGVDWWQDPIINLAKQKGFPEERIHIERFTAKLAAPLLDKVFDVTIKSSGKVLQVPGDKTVTAFLEEKGVKIPTSCEQGMCGTCKVKVLEGEIDHRDKRLSAEQKAEGYFLPCVSRGKTNLVLDL
jgi:vanillate O-demethylase ferredoxin subunit